jgi:tetratricopeptide (TPR) repeat protein
VQLQLDEHLVCGALPSSATEARQTLAEFGAVLVDARTRNASAGEIAVECYLPSFNAAIALNDLQRAGEIRRDVDESAIPEPRLPLWWSLNFRLDYSLQDYGAADGWCRKGLAALQDQDCNTAVAYHQLAMIAQHEGDFDAAEQWLRQSLEIAVTNEVPDQIAVVCHQLGRNAQELLDIDSAESWYREALSVKEQLEDYGSTACTCHQLGMVHQSRADYVVAAEWYQKSIDLCAGAGLTAPAASSCYQLGQLSMAEGDIGKAEISYNKALELDAQNGTGHLGACVFGELGAVAVENGDYDKARRLYVRALELAEAHGSDIEMADVFGKFAGLAGLEEQYEECGRWYMKSILGFLKCNDRLDARASAQDLIAWHHRAPRQAQLQLREMWLDVGLGPFIDDEFDDIDAEMEQGTRSIDISMPDWSTP